MLDLIQTWANNPTLPPIIHITDAADKAYRYVKGRADGSIVSAESKFSKLNSLLMGGQELNTITTISAMSGAGKSTLAKEFRHSISKLNPKLKVKQIVFNFEMSIIAQINREIVTASKTKMHKLYSVSESYSEQEIKAISKYYDELKKSDISFVEVALSPEIMIKTLYEFWRVYCKDEGYTMIYEIDNLMLLEGANEKEKIDAANYGLVALKKQIEAEGGTSIGLVLNQMNRNIEGVDRVNTPELHKPMASDLMAASSTNFCSDYIIFVHIPAKLGLRSYTTSRLPTKIVYGDRIVDAAYLELVKNRSGAPNITLFLHNRMDYFQFDEMSDIEKNSVYGADVQIDSTGYPLIKLNK